MTRRQFLNEQLWPKCNNLDLRLYGDGIETRFKDKSPIWTELYATIHPSTEGYYCWNIEFGHEKGPMIDIKTAITIAHTFLESDDNLLSLEKMQPKSKAATGW